MNTFHFDLNFDEKNAKNSKLDTSIVHIKLYQILGIEYTWRTRKNRF